MSEATIAFSAPPNVEQVKTCTKCGETKSWAEFGPQRRGKFGLAAYCNGCQRERATAWRKADPSRARATYKKWYTANPAQARAATNAWAQLNPEKVAATRSRRVADPKYRLSNSVAGRVRDSIRNGTKSAGTFILLGYTRDDLVSHLEKLFLPGMSWSNYGEWHLDHIVPISVHNYETPEDIDFKKAWSLSNLQPLWAKDNIRKGDRISAPFQPSLAIG